MSKQKQSSPMDAHIQLTESYAIHLPTILTIVTGGKDIASHNSLYALGTTPLQNNLQQMWLADNATGAG